MENLIVSIVFAVFIGFPLGLLFTNGLEDCKRMIATIVIAIAIGASWFGFITFLDQKEQKAWNNGYCTCGTAWTLKEVVHNKVGSRNTYYWYCKNCGEDIILRYDYAKNNQK